MLKIGLYVDNKYKILNEISRGGMGVVYMAVNEKVNKTWAIKAAQRSGIYDNNTAIQSLAADRRTLVGLRHPHLPSIVDIYETETSMMIVMDYIEGQPLSKSLEESGAQSQEDVIRWAKQLCCVLGYLHSKKIIYRDMKPSNVMLKPDGDIVLIDFGATRQFKEKNLADTQCLGTIGYAAPEQFGGQGQTDARTDIYGLGATLHHLITGIDPCRETTFQKAPIRQINQSLSGGLERIIEKCLQDDKNLRYQSCAELMVALENYEKIDNMYQKKQRKRLLAFAVPALLTLFFVVTSVFGYASAESRLSADYNLKIASAENAQLQQDERIELCLDAIRLNESESAAYLYMMKIFLSGDRIQGNFTREEASVITQLKAGLDMKDDGGYAATIYPLETLRIKNPPGYEQLCYEIGMAYWYDYEVEDERYSSAIEWLDKAVDRYPIAGIYTDIGACQLNIKRFAGQNRTEMMYGEYGQLWEKLTALANDAARLEDNDTKLLAWRVIVDSISDKAGYFLVNVKKEDILAMTEQIATDAGRLKQETKYEDIRKIVEDLLLKIDEAGIRIRSAE